MPDSTRYRVVDFIGGRILEAREMMTLQNMIEGVDTAGNIIVQDLNALYRDGATLNVVPSIGAGNTNVTLSPIDNTKPMQVFVHGRWETLRTGDAPTVTMGAARTLFLNWAINVITSVQDPSLVDGTTGEATANMGELDFSVSSTDTSGVALGANQLAKNTTPIVLFSFATAGSSLTVVPLDNAKTPALGNSSHAGLVKLTTDTANGVAVSTDDPRMSSARAPLVGSVVDASVRTPSPTAATNPDGSRQYDLTGDPGGISADKIIFQTARERLSDFLAFLQAQVSSVVTTLSGHIGSALGLANTHPMPSASQVGAAPLSHVNLPLGVAGSHPAVVNSDSGGFQVNQTNGDSAGAGAFELLQNGARVAAIQHNGDFESALLNPFVFNPGGGPLTFTGTLFSISQLAAIVRDHVNQNTRANPHGLTLNDLGGATVSLSSTSPQVGSVGIASGIPNAINYLIIRFAPNAGNAIEVAIGFGFANSNDQIPLPNGNFGYDQFFASLGAGSALNGSRTINGIEAWLVGGSTVHYQVFDNNHVGVGGTVGITAIAWRTNA